MCAFITKCSLRLVLPLNVPSDSGPTDNLVTLANSDAKAFKVDNVTVRIEDEAISDLRMDMPRINYDRNGQRLRYFYAAGVEQNMRFMQINKVSCELFEKKMLCSHARYMLYVYEDNIDYIMINGSFLLYKLSLVECFRR